MSAEKDVPGYCFRYEPCGHCHRCAASAENDAAAWADLSAAIRDYLTTETDVTRPSFHATALTHRIAGRVFPPASSDGGDPS